MKTTLRPRREPSRTETAFEAAVSVFLWAFRILLVLLVATVVAISRWPRVGFVGAAFFLLLLPSSSFVPLADLAAEHRMDLPLASVLALIVLAGHALIARAGARLAPAGVLLLVCLPALPVLAAPVFDARCPESSAPTLEVPEADLVARPVSSSDEALEGHLLERRIEAAARSVFAEDEAEEPETEEAVSEEPPAEAGGPTASGQEPSPFRRQMYRRDI